MSINQWQRTRSTQGIERVIGQLVELFLVDNPQAGDAVFRLVRLLDRYGSLHEQATRGNGEHHGARRSDLLLNLFQQLHPPHHMRRQLSIVAEDRMPTPDFFRCGASGSKKTRKRLSCPSACPVVPRRNG